MKTNLAAIIMPVKDAAGIVKESLDAIVKQRRAGWDVYVVDYGSTDDTKSIVQSYGRRSNINYMVCDGDGIAAARNTALSHIEKQDVHGMVAFCDPDDVWDSAHLGDCWAFLRVNPTIGVVSNVLKRLSSVVCDAESIKGLRLKDDEMLFFEDARARTTISNLSKTNIIGSKQKTIPVLVVKDVSEKVLDIHKFENIDGWLTPSEGECLHIESKGKKVIEIGSFKGKSSNYIASSAEHLSCVDTFCAGTDGQAQNGDTFAEFSKNTKQYKNITVFRGTSLSQKDKFEDGSVDVVFIDAMHDKISVSSDIEAYWSKLKPGGKMLFHDYAWYGQGVMDAVNERFGGPTAVVDMLAVVNKLDLPEVTSDVFAGKKIVISPFSKKLLDGKPSAKDYPMWPLFVSKIKSAGATVTQIGTSDEYSIGADKRFSNLSNDALLDVLKDCDLWISVDSFVQHFTWFHNIYGIVVFSQSDPFIFGHKENLNVLKHRKYLRGNQFSSWSEAHYLPESFVSVDELFRWTGVRLLKPDISGSVYSLT